MAGNAGRDGAVGHKDVAGCVFGGVGAARGPEPVSTGSEFCGVALVTLRRRARWAAMSAKGPVWESGSADRRLAPAMACWNCRPDWRG